MEHWEEGMQINCATLKDKLPHSLYSTNTSIIFIIFKQMPPLKVHLV